MSVKHKTHFATVERANESDNTDYWSDPICGIHSENSNVESDWKYITCKKCLKAKDKYTEGVKLALANEAEYYKGFVEHLKIN
jgi:hypothetical protein